MSVAVVEATQELLHVAFDLQRIQNFNQVLTQRKRIAYLRSSYSNNKGTG